MALPDPGAPVVDLFLDLVRIASPTRHEASLAAAIVAWLTKAGIDATVDDSAGVTGSDIGNVIARLATAPDRPTVLLVTHMDTVQPVGSSVDPILEDGVIRSRGETILGADNKAGVAAVLSVLARRDPAYPNVVAVFTTCEEAGVMGVTAIEDVVRGVDFAFPVDGSEPIGTVLEAALGQVPFDLHVRGRTSHAAKAPEQGIHAVHAASRIVAGLTMGWEDDSLLNVGGLTGGGPTNVVPETAVIHGEVRGYTIDAIDRRMAAMRDVAGRVGAATGADVHLELRPHDGAPPFPAERAEAAVALVEAAAENVSITIKRKRLAATLEANFLSNMGISTLGIASGGQDPHSFEESLPVAELERLVALLDSLLRTASERGRTLR
jgi:tripeptide aminopeptidase